MNWNEFLTTASEPAMTHIYAPLRLRIDGSALAANWKFLKSRGSADCGAAVKADGYGVGAKEVVKRLRDAGCRDFFVAHWQEATELTGLIPAEQIAVLNGIDANNPAACREIGAIPVLNTPDQIALWKASGGGRCHIMLDTGINRLGIGSEQIAPGLLAGLDIDILLSHLASADEDSMQNAAQLNSFVDISKTISCRRRSLANSAGIMLGQDYHFDLTRPGLSLYGGIARPELQPFIKQVVYIQSQVLQIRDLVSGAKIGYNASYICKDTTKVATCSVGYADGYRRGFSDAGMAKFQGAELPVIGRVSMDLLTLDISCAPDLREGDWVDICYDLQLAAHQSKLPQYELLTGLGRRFDRIWF
jgi:alanine racemase